MSRSNRTRSDGDWTARHARTVAGDPDAVGRGSAVRFDVPGDDWSRRHARTRDDS